METLRLQIHGHTVLFDAADWESEKVVEFTAKGLLFVGRPCDVRWRIQDKAHTSYVRSTISGSVELRLHRLVCCAKRGQVVDHINHSGLDNRRDNIRVCTPAQNSQNCRGQKDASSCFAGVSLRKQDGKWEAYSRHGGRLVHIGLFKTEIEAARARDAWVRANRPEFGYLNFPDLQESTP